MSTLFVRLWGINTCELKQLDSKCLLGTNLLSPNNYYRFIIHNIFILTKYVWATHKYWIYKYNTYINCLIHIYSYCLWYVTLSKNRFYHLHINNDCYTVYTKANPNLSIRTWTINWFYHTHCFINTSFDLKKKRGWKLNHTQFFMNFCPNLLWTDYPYFLKLLVFL